MRNVGTPDRIIRLILGAVLIVIPFVTGWGIWANVAATIASVVVGVVLIGTAVLRVCPIYAALRISTARAPKA